MIPSKVTTIMVDEEAFNAAVDEAFAQIRRDRMLTVGGVTLMLSRYLPAGTTIMLDRTGHIVSMVRKKKPAATVSTVSIVEEPAPTPASPEGAGA